MISDAIKKMQAMARKAQEETYDGKCTVTEFQPIKDPKTKITSEKEVVVLEDEPCRLSYSNVSAVDQTEAAAKTAPGHKTVSVPGYTDQVWKQDHSHAGRHHTCI